MSTQHEAMRLAAVLEAQDLYHDKQAAAELRRLHEENERLKAQSQQEPVAWMEAPYGEIRANPLYKLLAPQSAAWSIPLYTAPSQVRQDVVAYLVYAKGTRRYFTLTFDVEKVPEIYKGGEAVPLYTSPQPSKPWVGLTDEEIDALYEAHHNQYGECETPGFGYERAIEAKLREKNNG